MSEPSSPWRWAWRVGRWPLAVALVAAAMCATDREVVRTKPHGDRGGFVDVAGISTYYEHAGSGEPAVLLIHGLAASTYTFHANLEPLSERFEVYALDLKGFGATEKPVRGYGLDQLRDHVSGFMDTVGVDRAVVVGHSMGGEIAIRLALHQPERVLGLVLIDSAGFYRPDGVGEAVAGSLRRVESESSLMTWEAMQAYGRPLRAPGGFNALMERVAADDWGGIADRIGELDVPVLVLWGERDHLLPAEHAQRFQEALPDAQVIVYAGLGHRPQMEAPEQVNQDVIAFIESVE